MKASAKQLGLFDDAETELMRLCAAMAVIRFVHAATWGEWWSGYCDRVRDVYRCGNCSLWSELPGFRFGICRFIGAERGKLLSCREFRPIDADAAMALGALGRELSRDYSPASER